MELFYSCDRVISDNVNPNLPIAEIKQLNSQMQCNLGVSEESELYFDFDDLPEHVSIVDEMEMFCRDSESDTFN